MNPTQLAALMMMLADLRIERDSARVEAARQKQENDQLKAELKTLKETADEETKS